MRVIAKVAEAIPNRIRRLIFFDAFVLNDGEILRDNFPPHLQALLDELVRESNDRTVMLPFEIWREVFINDADIELARSSYAQLSPEPYQPWIDKLDLKQFYSLPIPKSYIYCTEDNVLPQGEQWGWHPRMSNRLGQFRFVQMPEAQNAQDLEALLACFAPNFQGNHPRHPDRGVEGIEDIRKNWSGIFHAIPDFHSELLRSAVEGDTAWAEWYWFGTHRDGSQFGMRGVTILGIPAERIEWARLYMEPSENNPHDKKPSSIE